MYHVNMGGRLQVNGIEPQLETSRHLILLDEWAHDKLTAHIRVSCPPGILCACARQLWL